MPVKIHPKYSEKLDVNKPLPHAEYESFCRAVARAESMTDAYKTYIEPEATTAKARAAGPKLWGKWWIRARVRAIEAELQRVASARAPLVKDDVLDAVCRKFKEVDAMTAATMKDAESQSRAMCHLGEMICKLTGAYAAKPQKNEVLVKVRRKAEEEEEA